MGALNPQTGTLSWTQTSVVHRSEAEGTVAALDLSTPFFVLLSVWLTSDDMAELSVVCRVRGSAADQVVFCVERPQRLLSREIPLKMRRSSFISAGEFEVVWPILRQAARLHGSDPGPLV